MPDYIRLDTDALNALPPREAYQAATRIHGQAKALGAAYADRLATTLAAEHGQVRAAELLGIAQSTLASRVSRYKKENTMPRTITVLTPQGAREVSRVWEPVTLQSSAGKFRTWRTRVGQNRWSTLSPVYENRKMWWALEWVPADSADYDVKVQATTAIEDLHKDSDLEDALRYATLWLHENPMGPQPATPKPRPSAQTHTVRIPRYDDDVVVTWQRRIYPENLGGGVGPWRAVLNGEAATVVEQGADPLGGLFKWEFSVGEKEGTVTAATWQNALKEIVYLYGLPASPTD